MTPNDAWSSRARHVIRACNITAATFSVVGAGFVILCAVVAPAFARGRTFSLVKRLALADFFFSAFALMGDRGADAPLDQPTMTCVIQGAGTQIASLCQAMYATTISHALATAVGKRAASTTKELRENIRRYDAAALGVSLTLACVPMFTGTYGDSGLGRCHVKHGVVRVLVYFVPIWLCMGYNVYNWGAVWRTATRVQALDRSLDDDPRSRAATKRLITFVRRLLAYPFIQVSTNVPGTALRLASLFGGAKNPSLGLTAAHVACKTSQGFLHAVVFLYAHPAKRELVAAVSRAIGLESVALRVSSASANTAHPGREQDGGTYPNLSEDIDFISDDDDDENDEIGNGGTTTDEPIRPIAGDPFVRVAFTRADANANADAGVELVAVASNSTHDDETDNDDDDDDVQHPSLSTPTPSSSLIPSLIQRSDDR